MGRKLIVILITLAIISSISCRSGPEPSQEPAAEEPINHPAEVQIPTEVQVSNQPDAFDPTRISQEFYFSTRTEVQQFIEGLNLVISNRNYNAWRAALSPEYFAEISSPQNLRQWSEQPALKVRNIVLRTPQDYFTHVVVPSRANLRVDDIEFISMSRVKAFTINTTRAGEEQRLLLYNLEKINNTWTIVN